MPGKAELVDYAGRAFALAQATVAAVGEDDYLTPMQVDPGRAAWPAGPDQSRPACSRRPGWS